MTFFDESKVRREQGKFANKDAQREEAGQVDAFEHRVEYDQQGNIGTITDVVFRENRWVGKTVRSPEGHVVASEYTAYHADGSLYRETLMPDGSTKVESE